MNPFTYDQLPARIVFGAGRLAEVGAEVERLGAQRVMLISDGRRRSRRGRDGATRVTARPCMGRGRPTRAGRARRTGRAAATEADVDCVVSIGGGSSTGLPRPSR